MEELDYEPIRATAARGVVGELIMIRAADERRARAESILRETREIRGRLSSAAERDQTETEAYVSAAAQEEAACACLNITPASAAAFPRPDVGAIERPDFVKARREAVEEVQSLLKDYGGTPDERLAEAARLADAASRLEDLARPRRDRAIAALAFFTQARALDRSAGISRTATLAVQARALGLPRHWGSRLPPRAQQPAWAQAARIPYRGTEAEQLPELAVVCATAKAEFDAALAVRNSLVHTLTAAPYNWKQTKIAEVIGRDDAVVNRILRPS